MKRTIYPILFLVFSLKLFAQTDQPSKTWTLARNNSPQKPFTFTPSGFLMVADGDKIRMINTQSNQDVVLKAHRGDVHLLRLNFGANHLISASTDNDVKSWDLTSFKEIPIKDYDQETKAGKKGILSKALNIASTAVKYLPNGDVKEVVRDVTYIGGTVLNDVNHISDIVSPKNRKFNPLKAVAFTKIRGDNLGLFVSDVDRAFEVIGWEIRDNKFFNKMTIPKSLNPNDPMLFSASGQFLAHSYAESATTKIWDMATAKEVQTIPFSKRLLRFSPDNESVVVASDEGILFWNIEEGTNTRFLEVDKRQEVTAFSFQSQGRYFACAVSDAETGDNEIIIWDSEFGKRVLTINIAEKVADRAISFSPDGNFLAYQTVNNRVEMWDIKQMLDENRQSVGKSLLPKVNWEIPLSNLTVPSDNFELKACIASSSKVRDVKVYVNDKLVNPKDRGLKPVVNANSCEYPLSMNVRLGQGQNRVYIAATNKAGYKFSESRNITVGAAEAINKELTGKQIALIIGNADYVNGGKLANPVNDATDLAANLQQMGFEVMQKANADLRTMEQMVDEFSKKARYFDVAMVFYAGHGVQVEGENYLVPTDAVLKDKADVKYKCLPLGMLLSKMEGKARTNIIVLDACRNNPFERGWSRSANGNGMAVVSAPKGTFIGFATAPGQTANDGAGKNGVYTAALLRHINTKSITIDQLFTRINNTVDETTSGAQVPWKTSSLSGDYYFMR
jgi:WD40 repeat protein